MKRKILWVAAIGVLSIGVPLLAQEPEMEARPGVTQGAAGKIDITFKGEINTLLQSLAYMGGVNIVSGPQVTGEISIRLKDVTWEEALEVVVKMYGFAYEREGNIIRVTTVDELKKEELNTQVFALNFAKAEEVATTVEEMLTERGKIKYDERTNVLVITDIPTNIYKIGQVINTLDQRTPQVLIEARIIETTLDSDEKLGIDWTAVMTAAGAKVPSTLPFDRDRASFGGSTDQYVPIGDPDASDPAFPTSAQTSPGFPYADSSMGSSGNYALGTLNFTQFQAVFEILNSRTDTTVISNPRITTLNNQPANILVGEIRGIPTFERHRETGTMEVTGYTERSTGTLLHVVPHINPEGTIVVELNPEISSFQGWEVIDSLRGIRAPYFTTRSAVTQVMINDGETIFIGGLIKETDVDYEKKVPLLGDIPILGLFFKKTEKGVDKTELVVFVTVHLVGGDKEVLQAEQAVANVSEVMERAAVRQELIEGQKAAGDED